MTIPGWQIQAIEMKLVSTAIAKDPFEEVGRIHTCQGFEFDYVGATIGLGLQYENSHVITDVSKRAWGDYTVNGLRKNKNSRLADQIIRNALHSCRLLN